MSRLILNKQVLYGYHDSVQVSPYYAKPKYARWIGIEGVCDRENCTNTEEHYIYDGQIFFQPNTGKGLQK